MQQPGGKLCVKCPAVPGDKFGTDRHRCGTNSRVGNSSLAAETRRTQLWAGHRGCPEANLAFSKNGQTLNRFVLCYGLSAFVLFWDSSTLYLECLVSTGMWTALKSRLGWLIQRCLFANLVPKGYSALQCALSYKWNILTPESAPKHARWSQRFPVPWAVLMCCCSLGRQGI